MNTEKIRKIGDELVGTYGRLAKDLDEAGESISEEEVEELIKSVGQRLRVSSGTVDIGTTADDIYQWLDGMDKEERESSALRCSRHGNYIVLSSGDWYQLDDGDCDDLEFPREKDF